jgi:RNA polymerase sigma-70 factor, ECF subfamily
VIKPAPGGHALLNRMPHAEPALATPVADDGEEVGADASAERLRAIVIGQHAVVWRMLRRFGVSTARVDEAVSRVFDVLARRLGDVVPGKEQAFLVQVSARVASELRRADVRRARVEDLAAGEQPEVPSPEQLFEQHEARAMLDEVLDTLDPEVRAVFVLYELEQWTAARIAATLGLRPGTVASRLKRARDQFEHAAAQLRRRLENPGRGTKP